MDAIIGLTRVDFSSVFLSVFTILVGLKAVVSIFEWFVNKLGLETKWMKDKREERELLVQTSQSLAELQKKHIEDTMLSDEHDENIRKEFTLFMDEIKHSMLETQDGFRKFSENRIHDREQSRKIQKELTDAIKGIIEHNDTKDMQINNIIIAQREVLADKINEKYKYYISIKGIPEDEFDEFTNLHAAYKGVGGNHSGDEKYEYCINHLQVIPVETTLLTKE